MEADAVVLARMTEGIELMRAAGVEIDPGGGAVEHLRRAVRFQRYARAAPTALHRACAVDIARGSMRLWARAGGTAQRGGTVLNPAGTAGRQELQLVRVRLSLQVRRDCAALRSELTAAAAEVSRGGIAALEDRFHREAHRVAAGIEESLAAALSPLEVGDEPAVSIRLPPRRPRLENRLTALLGAGFGAGLSLTVGRLTADLGGEFNALVAVGAGILGLALTSWVVRTRLLLSDRAALERRILTGIADLRAGLEERVVIGVLAAGTADPVFRSPVPAGGPYSQLTAGGPPALTFG